VPQQPNSFDCGIYTIHFAETFLQHPAQHVIFMASDNESANNDNPGANQAEFDEKWRISSLSGYRENLKKEIHRQALEESERKLKKYTKILNS
jgi:Ulp1 family protease